uniref:Uncharacterized protein n=1 Tax=Arundo donax TaxID=35708 RepID=A0A0A9DRG6_ARUDO
MILHHLAIVYRYFCSPLNYVAPKHLNSRIRNFWSLHIIIF